jgi:hypothetical protein
MSDRNFVAPTIPSADTLRRLAISESGFVFDPVSGNNFTVNDTGLVLLRYLQKTPDFPSLIDELQRRYDATPNDIERDVIEFIGMLREFVGE